MFCDRLPCRSPLHTDLSVGCLRFAGGSGSSKDDERIAVRVFSVLALTPGVYVFVDSSKKVEIVRTLLSEVRALARLPSLPSVLLSLTSAASARAHRTPPCFSAKRWAFRPMGARKCIATMTSRPSSSARRSGWSGSTAITGAICSSSGFLLEGVPLTGCLFVCVFRCSGLTLCISLSRYRSRPARITYIPFR